MELSQRWSDLLKEKKLEQYVQIRFDKGSGHGGQKINKSSNKATVSLGGLSVSNQSSRSKELNQRRVMETMRLSIAMDWKSLSGVLARPDLEIKELIIAGKIDLGAALPIGSNNKYLAWWVGVIIDCYLFTCGDRVKTSQLLNVSSNRLDKFINEVPHLRNTINNIIRHYSNSSFQDK